MKRKSPQTVTDVRNADGRNATRLKRGHPRLSTRLRLPTLFNETKQNRVQKCYGQKYQKT